LETKTIAVARREGSDCHEVSILIRVGDGERAGRAPSKVSTMIEGLSVSRSSVSRSVSAGARSGVASK
jgi:hypothetical protein